MRIALLLLPLCAAVQMTTVNIPVVNKTRKFNFIGIFSMCNGQSQKFDMTALTAHIAMAKVIFTRNYLKRDLGFISFDVCHNNEYFVHVLVNLLLSPTWYNKDINGLNNVVAVYTHVSENLTRLANYILSNEKVPHISSTSQSFLITREARFPWFADVTSYTNVPYYLIQVLTWMEWSNVAVICLEEGDEFETIKKELWDMLTTSKRFCPVQLSTCVTDANGTARALDYLSTEDSPKVVILIGSATRHFEFLDAAAEKTNVNRKSWILCGLKRKHWETFNFDYKTVQFVLLIEERLRDYFQDIGTSVGIQADQWITMAVSNLLPKKTSGKINLADFLSNKLIGLYQRVAMVTAFLMRVALRGRVQKDLKHDLLIMEELRGNFESEMYYPISPTKWALAPHFDLSKHRNESTQWLFNIRSNPCNLRRCAPGHENIFTQFFPNETKWTAGYGWVCRKCKHNFVNSEGFGFCTACTEHTSADGNRTTCSDLFSLEYLKIEYLSVQCCIFLIAISTLFGVFCIIMFIKYRHTPCVKSFDANLTFLHLTMLSLNAPVVGLLMIGEPSSLICMMRPFLIGVGFTLTTATAFAKAQKMITVFQPVLKSRTRVSLSKTDILKTHLVQWFILAFFGLLSALMSVVLSVGHYPDVQFLENSATYVREAFCNTDYHLHAQVALVIVINVLCNVQGFRTRRLPSSYKESRSILFATFCTTLCLILIYPLYYSQPSYIAKTATNTIILCISNIVFMVNLYGQRLYLILFNPKLNTMDAFLKDVSKSVQKAGRHVSISSETKSKL